MKVSKPTKETMHEYLTYETNGKSKFATVQCSCGHSQKLYRNKSDKLFEYNGYEFGDHFQLSHRHLPCFTCENCGKEYRKYVDKISIELYSKPVEERDSIISKNRKTVLKWGLAIIAIISVYIAYNLPEWKHQNEISNQWQKDMIKKKEIEEYLNNE